MEKATGKKILFLHETSLYKNYAKTCDTMMWIGSIPYFFKFVPENGVVEITEILGQGVSTIVHLRKLTGNKYIYKFKFLGKIRTFT